MASYHVVYDTRQELWAVRPEGEPVPILFASTQGQAAMLAKRFRDTDGEGGNVKVHEMDGSFSDLSE